MNSENSGLGQVVQASLGRQIHQRLAYACARERMLEAREYLANGEPVAAAHGLEAGLDEIEDGGREELSIIDALGFLPPVFAIDAWLHARRYEVLERLAKNLGWETVWSGEAFRATLDDGAFDLHVNAADGWRCTSGMPDMLVCGVGLTALHAHLKQENLAATVARLAPSYSKYTKGG